MITLKELVTTRTCTSSTLIWSDSLQNCSCLKKWTRKLMSPSTYTASTFLIHSLYTSIPVRANYKTLRCLSITTARLKISESTSPILRSCLTSILRRRWSLPTISTYSTFLVYFIITKLAQLSKSWRCSTGCKGMQNRHSLSSNIWRVLQMW